MLTRVLDPMAAGRGRLYKDDPDVPADDPAPLAEPTDTRKVFDEHERAAALVAAHGRVVAHMCRGHLDECCVCLAACSVPYVAVRTAVGVSSPVCMSCARANGWRGDPCREARSVSLP